MSFLNNRSSRWWRLYENVTAIFGWLGIMSVVILVWNSAAQHWHWPELFPNQTEWLVGVFFSSVIWVFKADILKYRLTRDPRDLPIRKWFSFKHAQRYLPDEVIVVPDGYTGDKTDLRPTRCPKCSVYHGFYPTDTEERRCHFYGCKAAVSPPSAAKE